MMTLATTPLNSQQISTLKEAMAKKAIDGNYSAAYDALINFWGDEAMLKMVGLWLLVFAQVVGAGEIYKWTDENGKVHFGDKTNAPKQSQEVIVKPVSGTGAMPSKYEFTTKELPKTAVENPKRSNSIDLTTPAVAKCSGLAKQYIVNDDNAEREALISKIKSMCRGVSFYCWSYKANPSRNRCEAGQTRLDGVTVEYTTIRE